MAEAVPRSAVGNQAATIRALPGNDGASAKPTGDYTLSSHAANNSTGTWTLEPDGHGLRLDPNAKDEADRVYTLVDNDALQAANGTQVLRRAGGSR